MFLFYSTRHIYPNSWANWQTFLSLILSVRRETAERKTEYIGKEWEINNFSMVGTSRKKYRNWKQKFKSEGSIITLMMMGRQLLWLLSYIEHFFRSPVKETFQRENENPFRMRIAIWSRNIRKVWEKLKVRFMKQRGVQQNVFVKEDNKQTNQHLSPQFQPLGIR